MSWTLQTKLTEIKTNAGDQRIKAAANVLSFEIERLAKQRCPYCDGFGHSGNDCPTDHKIAQLRGGVNEQNKVL